MLCKIQLCLLLCLGVYLARAFTPECPLSCDPTSCPSVQCQYGTVLDLCGCCRLCGAGLGNECAANFESLTFYDSCVDGLVCISSHPEDIYNPGNCIALGMSSSSSTLPQPTSTQISWTSSSTKIVSSQPTTRVAPSVTTTTTTTTITNPVPTASSASAQVWTTTSGAPSQPSASRSMLVTTASSVSLTATPAPIPTNSTPSSSNSTAACRELCSVSYCSASSSNVCSAQGDLAFQPVSQRGVCQHTACGACFLLRSPDCPQCPDPATPSCLKQYSTCVSNFYFQNMTNNALMRLDDPRAASAHGKGTMPSVIS
ncbi:hypothetical protein EMCRGX_G032754 [Ephydatia muelleri]